MTQQRKKIVEIDSEMEINTETLGPGIIPIPTEKYIFTKKQLTEFESWLRPQERIMLLCKDGKYRLSLNTKPIYVK